MLLRISDRGGDEWGMRHVGKEREMHIWFWWGNLKQADRLENLGVEGDKMTAYPKETGWEGVDWIYVAEYSNKCWVFVNVVRFPWNVRIFTSFSSKNYPLWSYQSKWVAVILRGPTVIHHKSFVHYLEYVHF